MRKSTIQDSDGNDHEVSEAEVARSMMDIFGVDVSGLKPGVALVITKISGESAIYDNPEVDPEHLEEMMTMGALLNAFMYRMDNEPEYIQEMLDWYDENGPDDAEDSNVPDESDDEAPPIKHLH